MSDTSPLPSTPPSMDLEWLAAPSVLPPATTGPAVPPGLDGTAVAQPAAAAGVCSSPDGSMHPASAYSFASPCADHDSQQPTATPGRFSDVLLDVRRGGAPLLWQMDQLAIEVQRAPDSLAVGAACHSIGLTYDARGQLDEAQQWMVKGLSIAERCALDIAAMCTSLGNVHQRRGQLDAALQCQTKALGIREAFAPGSLDVAATYTSIGNLHKNQDSLNEGLTWLLKALPIQEALAPDSLSVAVTYGNIGNIHKTRGKLSDALAWHTKAQTIQEACAPDSMGLAMTYGNIGNIHKTRGKLDEALPWLQKAMAIQTQLAPESTDIAMTYGNIGNIYKTRGKLDEAMAWLNKALAIQTKHAPDSISVAMTLGNIGHVHKTRGQLSEALLCQEQALKIQEERAPGSVGVAVTYGNIGSIHKARGQFDKALACQKKALAIQTKLAPQSMNAAVTHGNIGNLYMIGGQLDKAVRRQKKALAIQLEALQSTDSEHGPESLSVAVTYGNIGNICKMRGTLEEALTWHTKALEIEEKRAPDSVSVAVRFTEIGIVYQCQGSTNDAEKFLKRAAELFHTLKCVESAAAVRCYCALAALIRDTDLHAALELLHRARTYGDKHALGNTPSPPTHVSVDLHATISEKGGEALIHPGSVDGAPCAVRVPRYDSFLLTDSDVPGLLTALEALVGQWTKLEPHPNVLRLLHVQRQDTTIRGTVYPDVPHLLFSDLCACDLKVALSKPHKDGDNRFAPGMNDFFPDAIRTAAAEIAGGLAHLHSAGYIHRDVKLDNILVTEAGVCKVGDLGLIGADGWDNRDRSIRGNSLYRAPELWDVNASAQGQTALRRYSVRADCWSFGVLLLDVACTLHPFSPPYTFTKQLRATLDAKGGRGGVLTDAFVWSFVETYFQDEDPSVLELFRTDAPLGAVLRQCLRVDPTQRITMYDAARLLRGQDSELLAAHAAQSSSMDMSHGLSGPMDAEAAGAE